MTVTEGATPSGCGWRRDISALSLNTDDYPLLRVRLRGRGTTPQYKVEVEYTDATTTSTGWIDAPADIEPKQVQLAASKIIKYLKLFSRSSTPNQTAMIDYDYSVVLKNPPLIPLEVEELVADLVTTRAVSGLKLKLLNDPLLGVTERRYSLDENLGTRTYDLSYNKHQSIFTGVTWNSSGKYGYCLYFLSSSSSRLETGYKTTIPASGALCISFWVKAAPGVSGIVCGFGKTIVSFNRVQFNWSSDKLRLYVKDDAGNILQHTTIEIIADNTWHHILGIVNPGDDIIEIYLDGDKDGEAAGTLGTITLDTYDLTFGCLHNDAGYTNYTTCYLDEIQIHNRSLNEKEAYNLSQYLPLSGAARAQPGNIVMVYLGAESENLVYKLITARIIDRTAGGEPNDPYLSLVCEDLGEILHERTFTKEYTTATQISTIVDEIVDTSAEDFYLEKDTTNRSIVNKFNQEGIWSLLEKLAEAATFSTGENGANFYVDPGGSLRFKRYGAFTCSHRVTDGGDGYTPNLHDIMVKESIKGNPRLVNDARIIVFEEANNPIDQDSWTESAEGWSSPDPTDSGYPQSDAGDKQAGTASIHFNTTNPGSEYRMRIGFPDINLDEFDQLSFMWKYGSGLSPENIDIRLQKGSWTWTLDSYNKTSIAPGAAASWHEKTVNIADLAASGNPGKTVNNLQIRAYRASGDLGTGGFLIDMLRFIRTEKAGTNSDVTSQQAYGKRVHRVVDKNITDIDYAGYVAANIVAHRKYPLVTARAIVPGRAQLGYRPPMIVTLTSVKDGILEQGFQIQRAQHIYTPSRGYTCTLDLVAAKTSTGAYEPKIPPIVDDMGMSLAMRMRILNESGLNSLRNVWK